MHNNVTTAAAAAATVAVVTIFSAGSLDRTVANVGSVCLSVPEPVEGPPVSPVWKGAHIAYAQGLHVT